MWQGSGAREWEAERTSKRPEADARSEEEKKEEEKKKKGAEAREAEKARDAKLRDRRRRIEKEQQGLWERALAKERCDLGQGASREPCAPPRRATEPASRFRIF